MKDHDIDDTISDEMLAGMRPFGEAFPDLMTDLPKRKRGQRGPGKSMPKRQISLRIDPEIIAAYRSAGPGWQVRMNEALKAGLDKTV